MRRPRRRVDEDILERRPYQSSPERYEYFLTEKGLDRGLIAAFSPLSWGQPFNESI